MSNVASVIVSISVVLVCLSAPSTYAMGYSPPSSREPVATRATLETAVKRLDVGRPGGADGRATGFRVLGTDFVVTNAHVVEGARAVHMRLSAPGETIELELRALAQQLDLAVLAPRSNDRDRFRLHVASLALGETPTVAGADVWAAGYPDLGFTLTKGIVSGLRSREDLSRDGRVGHAQREWSPDIRLVQSDCTLNPGNSGGPLLDSQDRVVAVNSWRVEDESTRSAYFSVGVHHLKSLLKEVSAHAMPFPPSREIRLASVAPSSPSLRLPPLCEVPDASKSDLQRAIRLARSSCQCSLCKGDGTTTVQRTVKSTGPGTPGRIRQSVEPCSRCGGTGVNPNFDVMRLHRLSLDLAGFDVKAGDPDPVLGVFADAVSALAANSFGAITEATSPQVQWVIAETREAVAADSTPYAVFTSGKVVEAIDMSDSSRALVITVGTADTFILTNAKLVLASKGDRVLLGGVAAGKVVVKPGSAMLVLQHGFAVKAP